MSESSTAELLQTLCSISRTYGADPEIVIAGGGNTSVKDGQKLWVKGSGTALATITPEGFVEMNRPPLETLLGRDPASKSSFITSCRANMSCTRTRRW
jgi:rhamnose utilization protein RhaD (predicted bifunctional aldolase and dehydrogenase)